jgi:hypothetical protein
MGEPLHVPRQARCRIFPPHIQHSPYCPVKPHSVTLPLLRIVHSETDPRLRIGACSSPNAGTCPPFCSWLHEFRFAFVCLSLSFSHSGCLCVESLQHCRGKGRANPLLKLRRGTDALQDAFTSGRRQERSLIALLHFFFAPSSLSVSAQCLCEG